jgi:hypothetical protein
MKGKNLKNRTIFSITKKEVQNLAKEKVGRFLDEIELKEVQKRIEFGLECWEDVIIYAIKDVLSSKSK